MSKFPDSFQAGLGHAFKGSQFGDARNQYPGVIFYTILNEVRWAYQPSRDGDGYTVEEARDRYDADRDEWRKAHNDVSAFYDIRYVHMQAADLLGGNLSWEPLFGPGRPPLNEVTNGRWWGEGDVPFDRLKAPLLTVANQMGTIKVIVLNRDTTPSMDHVSFGNWSEFKDFLRSFYPGVVLWDKQIAGRTGESERWLDSWAWDMSELIRRGIL